MRPYQVYAVENIVSRALDTNNNGYVWHTTGSGKTITSFKTSQILSLEPSINQVFFLVDRKDLDKQTLDEFNKFDPGCVDMTNQTDKLIEQIKDSSKPLIITTIPVAISIFFKIFNQLFFFSMFITPFFIFRIF